MRITASEPLTSTVLQMIQRIVKESKCPHESLRNSFPRYAGSDDGGIHFDSMSSSRYVYEINE